MQRFLKQALLEWRENPGHMPLILRGARQVGKSYLVESFAKESFKSWLVVNFEINSQYKACFGSLDPDNILMQLELLSGQKIVLGETLLFLDEIQECPEAIESLRYFKEKCPALHVIGAGSLLEFALRDSRFSMPVGRVQFLYLKPLSFKEFLWAQDKENLCDYLEQLKPMDSIPEAVHQELLTQSRLYLLLGGMPAVLNKYIETKSLQEARDIQTALLQTYRSDFRKYGRHHEFAHLETVFSKLPGLVSQQIKYSKLDPDVPSRNLKSAIEKLSMAGVITPVYATSASGLPLVAHKNERKFKILFLDVGLMLRACQVDPTLLVQDDILFLLQGAMMEQFVGQELLAYQNAHEEPSLYFWERQEKNSQAEVDYLTIFKTSILPIEVKSKNLGHLKSLKRFIDERKSPLGIRISEHPLSFQNQILSVPLYMIFNLKNLLQNMG